MLKVPTYSSKGIKKTDSALPKIMEAEFNSVILAQAIRVYENRGHVGLAKAQTRAEVNRTKKKWYKQKGTGGARHGAKSAPIFVGGGVAHGPRPIKRILSLPSKMKDRALAVALSQKARDREVVVVDGLTKIEKTKDLTALISKLKKSAVFSGKRFTFVLTSDGTSKATRNLKNSRAVLYKDLNAHDIFTGGIILLDGEAFEGGKVQGVVKAPIASKTTKGKKK